MLFFCFLFAAVTSAIAGYGIGQRAGRREERDRCLSLVSQSWQTEGSKLSPTARRIYHSIDAGHVELVTEDAFFGEPVVKRKPADSAHAHARACAGYYPIGAEQLFLLRYIAEQEAKERKT